MDPKTGLILQQSFKNGLIEAVKNEWQLFLILFILAIVIAYIDAKVAKHTHERIWKTKHIVKLLEEIKDNTKNTSIKQK